MNFMCSYLDLCLQEWNASKPRHSRLLKGALQRETVSFF